MQNAIKNYYSIQYNWMIHYLACIKLFIRLSTLCTEVFSLIGFSKITDLQLPKLCLHLFIDSTDRYTLFHCWQLTPSFPWVCAGGNKTTVWLRGKWRFCYTFLKTDARQSSQLSAWSVLQLHVSKSSVVKYTHTDILLLTLQYISKRRA
jgi:hypothetical protein